MFYSPTRNRIETQVALLKTRDCRILLTLEFKSEATKGFFLKKRNMQNHMLPELVCFLDEEAVEKYLCGKSWEEARKQPYVAMHSSGITGTLKVLIMKQGTMAAHDAFQRFPKSGEEPWYGHEWAGRRMFISYPWVQAGRVLLLSRRHLPRLHHGHRQCLAA